MKVSDYIADTLLANGAGTVFGFQGSNVTHLIHSAARRGLRYLQNHHEQASAFAANAYAEITGGIGAALSSSGPGAVNMISGVANAWFDSLPVLFLTGQLNTAALRKNKNRRQQGFQEFDIVSAVSGITKYAATVETAGDIRRHLEKALFLMRSGRMGPALLDLPHNVQAADIDMEYTEAFAGEEESPRSLPEAGISAAAREALGLIAQSRKPLLLLGGGAHELRNSKNLRELLERFDIPAVVSLKGLDVLPHEDPRFAGFIGSYGNRYANLAVAAADLLIVLGSRLDPRQIGDYPEAFAENAKIIQADVDGEELSQNVAAALAVRAGCKEFISALLALPYSGQSHAGWREEIGSLKEKYPSVDASDPATLPNAVIRAASLFLDAGDIITADVGQNQMWTAQSAFLSGDMRLLNSGGLGSMGFSLPAAIGAAAARPGAKVLSVSGDGGIQMNLQELGTVARERLPVKLLVMNNRSLGMIRSYQSIVFGSTVGSVEGFSSPDYRLLAAAYGIDYAAADSAEELLRHKALFQNQKPLLCEIRLAPDTEVHPEPAYRRPVYIQNPPAE